MTKNNSEIYKKELRDFGFPENQLSNRLETELLHMRDWAIHFSRQNFGKWNYQTMGGGYIEDNFFALSKVERR